MDYISVGEKNIHIMFVSTIGVLAHLEERLPCKQKVAGSSPADSIVPSCGFSL